MDIERLVVDTNIMDNAFMAGKEPCAKQSAGKVLFFIADSMNMVIALDKADMGDSPFILKEYRKNLGGYRYFEVYWMNLQGMQKVVYVQGVCSKEADKVFDDWGLQEEDRVFLYTAMGADKIIITEDSDFGVGKGKEQYKHRFDYITNDMGVMIFDANHFLDVKARSELSN